MAATRLLQKRFLSAFLRPQPHLTPIVTAPFIRAAAIQTTAEPKDSNKSDADAAPQPMLEHKTKPSNESSQSSPHLKYSAVSSLKTSIRHDMAMVFTCKVCETRSVKTVCRESYEKGVVVAKCGGCNNLHLIADRLGWFGDPGSVEELLAARGEEVRKGSVDTLSLTAEDLAGIKSLSSSE